MIQRNCTIFSDELGSGRYLWQPGGGEVTKEGYKENKPIVHR